VGDQTHWGATRLRAKTPPWRNRPQCISPRQALNGATASVCATTHTALDPGAVGGRGYHPTAATAVGPSDACGRAIGVSQRPWQDTLHRHERRHGTVRRPRVRGLGERFISRGLPLCKRRTREVGDILPLLRLHGISRDAWKGYQVAGYQHYEVLFPGYKYNMFDMQAALALPQRAHIDDWQRRRETYTDVYNQGLSDVEGLQPLQVKPDRRSSYHLYVVMADRAQLSISRDELLNRIAAEGIGVGVHFRSPTLQKFYRKKYGFQDGDFPVAEWASDQVLSLSLYPAMRESEVERVIHTVRKVLGV
jgi:hypothetical protein